MLGGCTIQKSIITISREYGSGGRIIGRQLANELGVPFYDREIIGMTAKKSGFSEKFVNEIDQQTTSSLLFNLCTTTQVPTVRDMVYLAVADIIRNIASSGACVIVGRCADYVLRKQENCFNTFIHAPFEERIRRVRDEYRTFVGHDEKELVSLIQKRDKSRASYYNYFTDHTWGNCQNYDLTINSLIGIDAVVSAIALLVRYGGEND